VLATRLPLDRLQSQLDAAARLHPRSRTAADFRADPALLDAEAQALAAADRIITPHAAIADAFGERAVHLPWSIPDPGPVSRVEHARPRILFPATTVARKGCYELREALRDLDVDLVTRGPFIEDPAFWRGISRVDDGPFDLVVLPAWIEHAPRAVLRAVASGIPAIVSTACGLRGVPGIVEVPPGDAQSLRAAIDRGLHPTQRLRAPEAGTRSRSYGARPPTASA
jgi:hypothetical protein